MFIIHLKHRPPTISDVLVKTSRTTRVGVYTGWPKKVSHF